MLTMTRAARSEHRRVDRQQPLVEAIRCEAVERDHLRRDVEGGPARDAQGARVAFLAPQRRPFAFREQPQPLARRVVEEVVPVALCGAVAEPLELLAQLERAVALHGRRQLVGVPGRNPGEEVGDRVRVAAHEVHGPVQQGLGSHEAR